MPAREGSRPPEVSVEVNGLRLVGTSAHRDYLEAIRDGRREVLLAELLADAVRHESVVVDAGAFLGYLSLLAGRRVGPEGIVYAFEPDPWDFPWLVRNVEVNGLADRVVPVPKALASRDGPRPFYPATADATQSSLFPSQRVGDPITVEATRLDSFLEGRGVDVVKIDVEGAELRALAGMERTLNASQGEVVLFVECNPTALEWSGASEEELVARIEALGFDVRLIDEGRRRLAPYDGMPEGASYVNLYCRRG